MTTAIKLAPPEYAAEVAAQIAARYGVTVTGPVKIVAQGTSGLPLPWEEVGLSWKDRNEAMRRNQKRIARVVGLQPQEPDEPRTRMPPPRPARLIQREADVRRLAKEGLTAHAISVALKTTRETVYQTARRLGITIVAHHRGTSPEIADRLERIREMGASGMTRGEIAAALGMKHITVKNIVAKNGIACAPTPHYRSRGK